MKKYVLMLVAVLAFGIAVIGVQSAVMAAGGSGVKTIDVIKKVKPAVQYDHTKHQSRGIVCADCHDSAAGGKLKADMNSMSAFHKACQTCHKEKGGNAPTACDGCHKP